MAEPRRAERPGAPTGEQEARVLAEFGRHYGIQFKQPSLLRLALTHRSYLSVTGQGPRESNERLEFLGDSVLGLVTSEYLYRQNPDEHEGQLTKTKSLLVSKAILSRRALAMGLGRFVLMSHSEVESGGRQRLSILADAFESVIGAIYLDQGFEAARGFIERWLLRESEEIIADKRHINYKSHLQEYVQSTFRTHPVYRIRSEMGPDHSKHFSVEVMVGRRVLGEGKGRNKKEAEQAAARDALDRVDVRRSPRGRVDEPVAAPRRSRESGEESPRRSRESGEESPRRTRESGEEAPRRARESSEETRAAREEEAPALERGTAEPADAEAEGVGRRRRGRRGGRGRRSVEAGAPVVESSERRESAERHESGAAPERREPREPRATTPMGGGFAIPPEDGRFERLRLEAEKASATDVEVVSVDEPAHAIEDDEDYYEEVGRPEGPLEERHVDLYAWEGPAAPAEPARAPERYEAPEPPTEDDADVEPVDAPEAEEMDDEPVEARAPELERESEEPARPAETPRQRAPEDGARRPGGYGRRRGRRGGR